MKTTLQPSWVPCACRWLAGFLLAFAALLWWLLVGDVYTSMRYSSSFATFSADETAAIIYLSIGACVLAAALSLFSAVRAPAKRMLSCFLLAVSLCLVPAAWFYAQYVAATTTTAVLDP